MSFRRGQAAMEYLMTYGWAILVIVIVLAALLYLGIFNLNPPEVCTMPAGMSCTKFYLSSTGDNMSVTIVNGLQKAIVITNITCSKDPNDFGVDLNPDLTLNLGAAHTFTLIPRDETGTTMTFDQGDSYSGKINIGYYFKDEGSSALRRISGNVYARAG